MTAGRVAAGFQCSGCIRIPPIAGNRACSLDITSRPDIAMRVLLAACLLLLTCASHATAIRWASFLGHGLSAFDSLEAGLHVLDPGEIGFGRIVSQCALGCSQLAI